jgi:hypothetical protein
MTAAPANNTNPRPEATDPASRPGSPFPAPASAEPGHDVRADPASRSNLVSAAADLVWVTFFAALVAVYLVAFNRDAVRCEASAGWGLAISLAAALLTFSFSVVRHGVSRVARVPQARPAVVSIGAAGVALVAASLAVTWVAVNLTLARDPAGAWMLTVVALGAVIARLLSQLTAPASATQAAWPVPAPEPIPLVAEPLPVVAEPIPLVAEPLPVAEEEKPAAVVAELVSAEPEPESPEPELGSPEPPEPPRESAAEEPAPPEVVPEEPVKSLKYRGLLSENWEELLGAPAPRVAIDAGFWATMLTALGKRREEIGGVALTVRVRRTLILLGMVLPDQIKASGTFCEFPAEEVNRVRTAIDAAALSLDIDTADVTISWVHTHPRIGLFLSGTDVATARNWQALDPDFTPIVLDPLAKGLQSQIGVFDDVAQPRRPITSMRLIEGLANDDRLALLKLELLDAYQRAGASSAMVLVPGMD